MELEPDYWFAQQYAASAYIEKGMFAEAIAESRKARERSGISTRPVAFLGYALARSGKRAEARVELEWLLTVSKKRYVSPYNIAMIYHGLGEREAMLAWLEWAYQQLEYGVSEGRTEVDQLARGALARKRDRGTPEREEDRVR